MKNLGNTHVDVIAASMAVFFVVLAIVIVAGPGIALGHEHDKIRREVVEDYLQALLQLHHDEPETFAEVRSALGASPRMIGTGLSCEGSFGRACVDSYLQDDCLDMRPYLARESLTTLPVDPRGGKFNQEYTGYYLTLTDDVLEVGACASFGAGSISLEADLK